MGLEYQSEDEGDDFISPFGSRMASRPVSILELVTLREYAPLDSLFRLLPKKAQRVLALSQSNIDVEFTCVDASSEFIVLGSNISIVYVFDRQEQQLAKLRCEDKYSHVTSVKLLTCLDHQLAVGTSNGHVEIFLLPSRSHGHSVQAKKFVVENLHETKPVTCIEWSSNGMKLFTGDNQGRVIQTTLDFYENQCQASCVVTEEEAVVQLSYAHKKLLVSTTARTIICTPEEDNKIIQVGQKPRKSTGSYGAHFVPGLCKPSDATTYVARPGWRLWHTNTEGTVLETIMFKDLISKEHPLIQLLPDTPPEIIPPPTDLQLGHLLPFSDGLLVSWSLSAIVILQPFGPEGALVVGSNFGELGNLVSVAVTRHEIFALRKGCERCLVRIATAPEMTLTREPSKSEKDFGRIQITKLTVTGNSSQMTLIPSATVSSDRMTSTKLKNKFSSMRGFLSKAADDLADKAAETKNKMERNIERSFKLNLPIPEKSEDTVSIKSDRSSINEGEQQSSDPGTPEAMLSERLMVSVINSSNMSGERSPTGLTSPTAPFRSPANSFSGHEVGVRSRSNSHVKEESANGVSQTEADEPSKEDTTSAEDENLAVTKDDPKGSFNSAIEVTALKGSKHIAADRVSIVITEDPEEDQSAKVIKNLSKRISYASKTTQDTFENIDGGYSDSIVFQSKPKTKKKKKTVKGSKSSASVVEVDQISSPGKVLDGDPPTPSPSPRVTPKLGSIQEGEEREVSSRSGVDPEAVAERLRAFSVDVVDSSGGNGVVEGTGKKGDQGSDIDHPEERLLGPDVMKDDKSGKLSPAVSSPKLSIYTPPLSLRSNADELVKANNVENSLELETPRNEYRIDTANNNPSESGYPMNGHRLAGTGLSISLPRSLNSNDMPPKKDGDELSPIVSPRSPRSPHRMSAEEEEGRQARRLGVIMEDFNYNKVPEEDKQPDQTTSPRPLSPPAAQENDEYVSPLPVLPPRKKHMLLNNVVRQSATGSRPTSEFDDIYPKYRQTVIMMKESIYIEDPPEAVRKDDSKEASHSDNSETESQESDEGEGGESSLPDSIQQKLAGSWMQCTTPNYIYQLIASERHIWYVDNRDRAHHSLSSAIACKWSKLKDAHCRLLAVSPSGSIVWRVNPKTSHACSSAAITQRSHVGIRWIDVSKDVSHVCLDENMAWIIKNNGQLCVHKGISRDKPYTKDTFIDSNVHVLQIAANSGVVWARTASDKVVYRAGITSRKQQGQNWMELPDDEHLRMVCIALDSRNTGWAIDHDGMVWFRTGVTVEKPMGDDQKWWQVCMSEYLMEDPNVLRMMVNMAGSATKVDRVVNWLKKQCYKATAIAANSSSVWVCSSYHYKTTLHVSRGNLLGSRWELSNPVGLAASATWKCVCASPSYGPSGMIWALQTSGEIFCFSPENRKPNMVQSPDHVVFEYIGATSDSVWALSTNWDIYVRMNITQRCPGGTLWKKLNLNQFGTRRIVHFTLGSETVWAVDSAGDIHFRYGVHLPKHDALPLAWVPVEGKPVGYGVYFTNVFCGPSNDIVWAIDNKKTVYARQGVCKSNPIGLGWEPVEGTQATQLCMSTDTVWALCPNGELACRFGISTDNSTGDYWKKISGNFKYATVSQNDELWTVNSDGRLFHRLTKMFIRSPSTKAATSMESTLPGEDDWELL
ncbi:tectonin beta-propeller repeat-containing protein 2-like [Lytechinus pictus]|uniref:tectonin beta-propeller repeat-containing protein 2-like n=1 Tax=Lytechinus pictus TaxID=7653 RepID=UPI0030BA1D51